VSAPFEQDQDDDDGQDAQEDVETLKQAHPHEVLIGWARATLTLRAARNIEA
jgi:hypothetical protein